MQQKTGGQVYAELLCDFMFKRLFGSEENKDVLIGFLNMVLEDVDIEDVFFIPTEHLGLTELDRKAIFDISCRCSDGSQFIIEIQKGYQRHFRKRALYYTTYPINEQGRQAHERYLSECPEEDSRRAFSWDFDLRPVTVVAILNFRFDHVSDWPSGRYHSSYRLREDVTGELMTDVLRFVFLELGRFNKRLWELETVFDKWMYLLKHMHEMVSVPDQFSDPLFRRLFMLAEIANFTPEDKKHYENSLKDMSDYYNIIHTAEENAEKRGLERGLQQGLEQGLVQGLEQGLTEGREEARKEIARRMLAAGLSPEQVSEFTGLSAETLSAAIPKAL